MVRVVLCFQPAPNGHPECLAGKTFVISGVLDSLYRPDAENLIKRHGGRVTGSVSGRTSFLLCGENTGQSKLQAVSSIVHLSHVMSTVATAWDGHRIECTVQWSVLEAAGAVLGTLLRNSKEIPRSFSQELLWASSWDSWLSSDV